MIKDKSKIESYKFKGANCKYQYQELINQEKKKLKATFYKLNKN